MYGSAVVGGVVKQSISVDKIGCKVLPADVIIEAKSGAVWPDWLPRLAAEARQVDVIGCALFKWSTLKHVAGCEKNKKTALESVNFGMQCII